MKPVKTRPRFRCDHCRYVATKSSVARHELICWQNPARFCPECKNQGVTTIEHGPGLVETLPCWYCSQRTIEDAPPVTVGAPRT